MEKTSNKIIEIVKKNLSYSKDINKSNVLEDIGIDSLTFIKIIIEIENEFSFEFEDSAVSLYAFSTMQDLIEYVYKHSN